jgi:hypothetical protein
LDSEISLDMTVTEEGSLEVTAKEVSRSLALTTEGQSLRLTAAEDGASGIIIK